MSVKELNDDQELDKTRVITYLSKFYELFRGTPLPASGSLLHCTPVPCTLLDYILLYSIVDWFAQLFSTVFYSNPHDSAGPDWTLLCSTLPCSFLLYSSMIFCIYTLLCSALLDCTFLCSAVFYCPLLYCTRLSSTVLYCTPFDSAWLILLHLTLLDSTLLHLTRLCEGWHQLLTYCFSLLLCFWSSSSSFLFYCLTKYVEAATTKKTDEREGFEFNLVCCWKCVYCAVLVVK